MYLRLQDQLRIWIYTAPINRINTQELWSSHSKTLLIHEFWSMPVTIKKENTLSDLIHFATSYASLALSAILPFCTRTLKFSSKSLLWYSCRLRSRAAPAEAAAGPSCFTGKPRTQLRQTEASMAVNNQQAARASSTRWDTPGWYCRRQ